MLWSTILTGLAAFASVTNAVTVFTSPAFYKKPGVSYPRALVLTDGTILITSENYAGEPPYMSIFESKDGGNNWHEKSRVQDTTPDGWGLRYHPTLIQIPVALAEYPAGSIVFAATSVPADGSRTKLHVFASKDSATTWEYVATLAEGGVALEQNTANPVLHPFLFFHNGRVICYYSDSRDPAHGVKIVFSETDNLKSWSDPVRQVAYDDSKLRPTIATVTQIGDKPGINGGPSINQYLMTYEYGFVKDNPNDPSTPYAVYYKIAEDPRNFDPAPGIALRGPKGEIPVGAPYAAYVGGVSPTEGTIIISSSNEYDLYVNRKADGSGMWEVLTSSAPKSYARCVVPLNSKQVLAVTTGPLDPGNLGDLNSITATVVDLNPTKPGAKMMSVKRWTA